MSFVISETETSPRDLGRYIVDEQGKFGIPGGNAVTGTFTSNGQVSGNMQLSAINGCSYTFSGSCSTRYYCSGSITRAAADPGNFCRYSRFTTNR